MKNKIKDSILHIGIFYMILIPILMIITYCNMVTNIEFMENEEYIEKLNSYKDELSSKEETTCKEYLNKLIDKIEDEVNIKTINIKEYYQKMNDENNLLSYYKEAPEKCYSITRELMNEINMPLRFLTPLVINEEIIEKYIYQYEIGFNDFSTREVNRTDLIPVENNITKLNDILIIEDFMKMIDWEKEV